MRHYVLPNRVLILLHAEIVSHICNITYLAYSTPYSR